jgi:hypothetical protein
MTLSTSQIQTDTWVKATWDEFVAAMDDPQYEKSRSYFDNGTMRIEMAALGSGHSRQNSVVIDVVSLFATFRNLRLVKLINGSFYTLGSLIFVEDSQIQVQGWNTWILASSARPESSSGEA